MSQRLKITLSDTTMAELKQRAERAGEPVARIAAQMVSQLTEHNRVTDHAAAATPAAIEDDDLDFDSHAPWIEPVMGDSEWRQRMWGSIVALHWALSEGARAPQGRLVGRRVPCGDAVCSRRVA